VCFFIHFLYHRGRSGVVGYDFFSDKYHQEKGKGMRADVGYEWTRSRAEDGREDVKSGL
jgi:hypothetical protein